MSEDTPIYQIVVEDDMGMTQLESWFTSAQAANAELEELRSMFPDNDYNIVEGTNYIRCKCRGCGTPFASLTFDAHGVETGYWCSHCYESDSYPYRKDKYPTIETHGYGEYLDN